MRGQVICEETDAFDSNVAFYKVFSVHAVHPHFQGAKHQIGWSIVFVLLSAASRFKYILEIKSSLLVFPI